VLTIDPFWYLSAPTALGTNRGNVTVNVPTPGTFGFTVIPDEPGVADLAPFVVFDDCGGWSSFAGAGRSATGALGMPETMPSRGTTAPAGPTGTVVSPAGMVAAPSSVGPAPAATTSTVSAKPPDQDRDPPRRLTEEQRQQRRRSDTSELDDTHVEGDVVGVDGRATPPTITIASRDGDVTLRLHGGAARQVGTVRVGDYVQAEGEKVHEGLYEIGDLEVEERAPR
jgi:hypothetical protein